MDRCAALWSAKLRSHLSRMYVVSRRMFRNVIPEHHGKVLKSSTILPKLGRSRFIPAGAFFSCVIGSGDPIREKFMVAELRKVGLESSVWLRNPNRPDVPPDLIRALKKAGGRMTEGEFSATLKHFLALHLFLQSRSDFGLVMEDRIQFIGDFKERLENYLSVLPRNFDMVFEGDMMKIPGRGDEYSRTGSADFSLYKMKRSVQDWSHGATNGAYCYLVTRSAAERIVRNYLPFSKVIDHHLNDLIRSLRLNVYWPLPPSVHRRVMPSTVQVNEDGSPAGYV